MDPILQDFLKDLNTIKNQACFIESIKFFSTNDLVPPEELGLHSSLQSYQAILQESKNVYPSLSVLTGSILLYLCGRFEEFVRSIFEDLCQRLAQRATKYSDLPKDMRENLLFFTAEVIKNPRKFGHAENGVKAFISNLSENLKDDSPNFTVNYQCLSITETNLRAEALNDLFKRVGAKNFWDKISNQAIIQTYFESDDTAQINKKVKKKLDDLMDLRNKIAHPSGSIEWPSFDQVIDTISFLSSLSRSISLIVDVYEMTLFTPSSDAG